MISDAEEKRIIDFYSEEFSDVSIHCGYVIFSCNFRDKDRQRNEIDKGNTDGLLTVEKALALINKKPIVMKRKSYKVFTTDGNYTDMAHNVKEIVKSFDKDSGENNTADIIAIVEISDRGISIIDDNPKRDRYFVVFYEVVCEGKSAFGSISVQTSGGMYVSLCSIISKVKKKNPKMESVVPTSIIELNQSDYKIWLKTLKKR